MRRAVAGPLKPSPVNQLCVSTKGEMARALPHSTRPRPPPHIHVPPRVLDTLKAALALVDHLVQAPNARAQIRVPDRVDVPGIELVDWRHLPRGLVSHSPASAQEGSGGKERHGSNTCATSSKYQWSSSACIEAAGETSGVAEARHGAGRNSLVSS